MTPRHFLLLPMLALLACGAEPPTTPTTDWIELNALTPAAGTTLTAGEAVTFTATVTCTVVNADSGSVVLVISDQGNRTLNSPPVTPLPKGSATVTLTTTITAPVTGSTLTLALPLFLTGSNSTRAAKTVTYPVR